jgi:hypothetical protein
MKFCSRSITNFRARDFFYRFKESNRPDLLRFSFHKNLSELWQYSEVFQSTSVCRNYGSVQKYFNSQESVGTTAVFESISIHKNLSELQQYSKVFQSTRICRNYSNVQKYFNPKESFQTTIDCFSFFIHKNLFRIGQIKRLHVNMKLIS